MVETYTKNPDLPLTYMQQKFVSELVSDPDHNATQAAIKAGFAPANARFQASQLRKKAHIAKAIEVGMEEVATSVGITKERVLSELAKLAFSDLSHLLTTDNEGETTVNLAHLPTGTGISEIEVISGSKKATRVKLSSTDRLAALQQISKMLGWSKDKVEISGQFSLERYVNESFEDDPEADVSIIESEA